MLSRYYQAELDFLRDLSREFAAEHPVLAPALAEAGSDPDVERLLEGTAFLTAAIREKLDDDLPEITQTLLSMLWPHYLRPVPSCSILEFKHPKPPKVTTTELLPARETEVASIPVDGTRCRFQTAYEVRFNPIAIEDAQLEAVGRGQIRIRFQLLAGAKLDALDVDPLRLFLHGDIPVATELRYWLLEHVESAAVECGSGRNQRSAELVGEERLLRPVGFAENEGLFPYPKRSFVGYRLLQEYFTLPQKFFFVDVGGMNAVKKLEPETGFDLVLRFGERPPETMRVSANNFRLHCSPIVNLMSKDADPVRLDPGRAEYFVRASDPEPQHFEVYSVDAVTGLVTSTAQRESYDAFYSFRIGTRPDDQGVYYKLRRRPAVARSNTDCFISFVSSEDALREPDTEIVSIELTCTNRNLAEVLKPGDVTQSTDRSPQFAEFQNITPLTPSVAAPLSGGFHWRLISQLALSYSSVASADALRNLLSLYDFTGFRDRQWGLATQRRLEGIESVETKPHERVFRGSVMRGMHTRVRMLEDRFTSDGELHLFGSVLDEFLALCVSVNAFSQLEIDGIQKGAHYQWPARVGQQFTL